MEQLAQLFQNFYTEAVTTIIPLSPAGSNRQYFRLKTADGESCIGVIGNNIAENRAFVYLARHFTMKGFPSPYIQAVSADDRCYLQEDLGELSLYEKLANARETGIYTTEDVKILEDTMRLLAKIQVEGVEKLNAEQLLTPSTFERRTIMFDLNYFKYCFLKTYDLPFNECSLEDDFEELSARLLSAGKNMTGFLYRDFQARNIMVKNNCPFLIDFQGGRIGPHHYDVASFLWQASAQYPSALKQQLLQCYIDELSLYKKIDANQFAQELQVFVLFRLLQVLGAYGLRGRFERKPYFLNSIPAALQSINQLLAQSECCTYPELKYALRRVADVGAI